jgi:extradiol dioxygenase family protein
VSLSLHHYAVAVRDLDEAAETYHRLFGMEAGERGRDSASDFDWIQLGYAGERTLLLVRAASEMSDVHRVMRERAHEKNPHGEGFYASMWHADDPAALARRVAAHGGHVRTASTSEVFCVQPSSTHGVPIALARHEGPSERPLWPSHLAVAVRDLDEAEQTFSQCFGLERAGWERYELDYGSFISSHLFIGATERLALMAPRSETSAVARRMKAMATPDNPRGEGVYLTSWAARDPSAIAERIRAAGGLVAGRASTFYVHPRSTHGVHMRVFSERGAPRGPARGSAE